jgi:hypothetical protein
VTLLLSLVLLSDLALLDRLQGTWHGANGTTLVIDGDIITATSQDGYSGFTARLQVGPRFVRVTDNLGTLQRPYRIEGRRLCLGDAEYRKTGAGLEPAE